MSSHEEFAVTTNDDLQRQVNDLKNDVAKLNSGLMRAESELREYSKKIRTLIDDLTSKVEAIDQRSPS